jgi:hypothetical protein
MKFRVSVALMRNLRLAIFFVGIVLLFSGCKKSFLNYRNKYVGDWKFHVTTTQTQMGSPTTVTEQDYDGKIEFSDDNSDEIIIYFKPDDAMSAKVSKNGEIDSGHSYYYPSGSFEGKKKLSIDAPVSSIITGNGSTRVEKITGTKD